MMTFISLLAGLLVAVAAVPKILARIRQQQSQRKVDPEPGDLARDLLILTGNILWVAFGVSTGVPAIIIFCSLNAALTAVLVWYSATAILSARS